MPDVLIEHLRIKRTGDGLLHDGLATELAFEILGCRVEIMCWESFTRAIGDFGIAPQNRTLDLLRKTSWWLTHHSANEIQD